MSRHAPSGPDLSSAAALLAAVRDGAAGPADIVAACRRAVAAREDQVGAWIALDWDAVAAQAAALQRRPDWRRLPLAALPVAVKDIFDTVDFPTAYGSEIYAGHRPAADAAAVAALRAAGALVIGKTVSTEFAYWKAGKTRNPHDPRHSPGGSSSGSAAAVAAGMVPLAIGSQTAASTIRPAAYCGIVGFKPSHGLVSLAGVKALAGSLDTVGVFAGDVAGAGMIAAVLAGRPDLAGPPRAAGPFSLRLAVAEEWAQVDAGALARTRQAVARLVAAGATADEGPCPPPFDTLARTQAQIMAWEAARDLAHERLVHGDRVSGPLRDLFRDGLAIPAEVYDDACARRDAAVADLDRLFDGADLLLAPSATGAAPRLEDGTGSPDMSRAWTLLGLPSLTVPLGPGPGGLPLGLPLGLQVAARPRRDRFLLDAAAWIESVLRAAA
ncbi:MAG: amidase [Hyphomicrobiales bacterium]|nr:amidase [Hyphomicrobiales bacterium]MCP5374193.1 amidase [Hyphomicrobiales bacterium]